MGVPQTRRAHLARANMLSSALRFALATPWRIPIIAIVSFAATIATGMLFSSLGIYPPYGFHPVSGNLADDLFGVVILSPVGETLILAAIIAIASRWLPRGRATLVGVAFSAAAHG